MFLFVNMELIWRAVLLNLAVRIASLSTQPAALFWHCAYHFDQPVVSRASEEVGREVARDGRFGPLLGT
jgi:hypothetical protein